MRFFLALILTLLLASCAASLDESNQPNQSPKPTAKAEATQPPEATAETQADNSEEETGPAETGGKQGDFDFYVMALSWSPDFCETTDNSDPQQCSPGRKLGFVLHGLWPQNNKGYPSDCSNERMPKAVKEKFPALYPNAKLYDHEWQKHGTCSGLTAEEYLALTQQLKESVIVPAAYQTPPKPVRVTAKQFKQEFIEANPTFSQDSMAVNCSGSGRFLKEMFICFAQDGTATACSAEIKKRADRSCGNPDFLVRNVR